MADYSMVSPRAAARRGRGLLFASVGTAAAGLFLSAVPGAVRAQTFYWTGSGANANFSTPANWLLNAAPPSAASTSLVFGASRNNSPNVDAAAGSPFVLGSLVFNPSTGSYNISSGTGVGLNFAGVGGSTLTQNATTLSFISNNVTLSTLLTINGSGVGNLTLSGVIGGTSGITINQTGQLALTSNSLSGTFTQPSGPLIGGSQILLNNANTFTGDVTLKNGNLVLGSATSLGNSANRLLIQAGTSSLRVAGSSTVANNIVVDPGAFLTYTGGTGTLSGVISGGGGLNVFGQGGTTLALTLNNAETYSGATTIGYANQQLTGTGQVTTTLNGANGALLNTSQISLLNNATLSIANTSTLFSGNRINDAASLLLSGGRILYAGQGTASLATASKETFGAVTLNGGFSVLTLSNTNNQLTFAKMNTPVDKGTWFVRGTIGGPSSTTTNNIFFTDASGVTPVFVPGTSGTGIYTGVVPFIAGDLFSSNDPEHLVTYDPTTGLRILNQTDATYTAQVTGTSFTPDANNNNAVAANTIAINNTQRINSLTTGSSLTLTGTGTLQIYSGAIATFNPLTVNGPTIDFGANTGYLHLGYPITFSGNSQVTGSGGLVVSSLDNGSFYTVTFNNSRPAGQTGAINPFTGGLFVNGNSTVAFNSDSQLGAAGGGITLNGGTLTYTNALAATLDPARTLKVGTVAGSPGTINVGTGTTLTIPSTITGAGTLIKTGTGTLALTGTNTNTGSIVAAAGVLQFNSSAALPTGGIISEAATLQPLNSMTLTAPITLTSAPGLTGVGTTTLNIASGQTLTIAGALKGSPGTALLNKTGGGILDIASNAEFGGAVTVTNGTVNVGTGSLRNASSLGTTSGTTLKLDYNAAGASTDKLGDQTGLIVNGGETQFIGVAGAQTIENFGLLTAGAGGASIITLLPGANGSLIATATLGYSGTGSLLFRGTNLGSTSGTYSQFFLTGQATGFITGATADTTATGTGLTQAFYDPTVGVRVARDTDYNEYAVIQDVPNAGPVPITANVLVGNTFANVTTGGSTNAYNTINGLAFKNNGTLTLAAGTPTLFLQSGGIFLGEGSNATITSGTIGGGTNTLTLKPIAISGNGNLTLASDLKTSGGLQKSGNGTLILTNAKTFTGGTSVSGGTLSFGTDNALTTTGAVVVGTGATINLNNTNQSFSALSGAGNTLVSSGNTLTVTGAFNSAGNFTVATGGAIRSTGTFNHTGVIDLASGSTLTLTGTANNFGGTISGAGAVVFNPTSAATLTVNAASTYSGGTTVGPVATLTLGVLNGFGTGPVTLTNTSATATTNFAAGTGTLANDINLSTAITTAAPGTTFNNSNSNQTVTLSGKISGGTAAKVFRFNGPGDNTASFALTNTNNDFAGTIEIYQGNVGITDDRVLGNAANTISLNASPLTGSIISGLVLNAQNITVARNIVATSSSAINTNGNNGSVSGVLSGSAALSKQGLGTLTLSNTASTYSGAMTVSAGTLNLTGNVATTATVNVTTAATLSGNNSGVGGGGKVVLGTVGAASSSSPNGVIAPGDSSGANAFGTLNLQSLQVNNGSVLRFDLNLASSTSDQILISQVFNKGTATDNFILEFALSGNLTSTQTYTLVSFNNTSAPTNPVGLNDITVRGLSGYNSQLSFDASVRNLLLTLSSSASATPEPSSLSFLLLILPGAGGVWAARLRKRAQG